jgi:hypothetical protein
MLQGPRPSLKQIQLDNIGSYTTVASPSPLPEQRTTVSEATVSSAMIQTDDETGTTERWIELQFTWAGKLYNLEVAESDRFAEV